MTPEEEELRNFNERDFFIFKWRILRFMCEMCEKYGNFTETELFFHTDLKAYMDDKFGQEYLKGKRGALYKLLMDRVMRCLIDRGVVKIDTNYEYGQSQMVIYKKTELLERHCTEIMRYQMGDQEEFDRLLPFQ